MSFKDELSNAKSNKEEAIVKSLVDDAYEQCKADCKQSAEWGYNKHLFYVKKTMFGLNRYDQYSESDYECVFRHQQDEHPIETDYNEISFNVFRDPDKIVEMLKEKLKADGLLDSTIFRMDKRKLIRTETKWVEYSAVDKGATVLWNLLSNDKDKKETSGRTVTRKVPYAEAIQEIVVSISWGNSEE